jgi:hypothetical protein
MIPAAGLRAIVSNIHNLFSIGLWTIFVSHSPHIIRRTETMRFPSFKLCQSFQGPMNTSKPSALHVTFRPSSPVTMMPRDNTCSSYGSVSEVPLAPLLLVFIPERLSSCRGERLSFRWQGSNPTPKDIALSEQELKPLLNLRNNYMFAFRPLGHWTSARSWWHCQIPALTAKGGHNKDTSSTTSKGTGMRFNIINLSFCSFKWINFHIYVSCLLFRDLIK